jgi:nitrogen fixation protein FixH
MIKNGKIWPVMIAVSIFGVVGLIVWTVKETTQADLSQSNVYMAKYQEIDKNINDIIFAKINFNKKYNLKYEKIDLDKDGSFISYSLFTKDNKPVNNAKLELIITRPDNSIDDINLSKPTKVKNGIYSYENIKLPKKGRWNLLLKVSVGEDTTYYNLKADTRDNYKFKNKKEVIEF